VLDTVLFPPKMAAVELFLLFPLEGLIFEKARAVHEMSEPVPFLPPEAFQSIFDSFLFL